MKPASTRDRAAENDGKAFLRPAERVREYILTHYDRPGAKDGARLPSVRRLATELNVSTATVQGIFQKLAAEGRIRSQVGNGSFFVTGKPDNAVLKIGVNIPVPEGGPPSFWTYQIYGGLLHGAFQAGRMVALKPLPPGALEKQEEADLFLRDSRQMDGFVLFHTTFHRRLRRLCEESSRPYVYLNPPSESETANFVSPDYYQGSRRLGEIFSTTGRRRVALLMWPSCEASVSVRLRCAGMAAGLAGALADGGGLSIHTADDNGEEAGHRLMADVLRKLKKAPDAVYCAGDLLAHGAVRALEAAGLSIPGDVAVVGGNGLARDHNPRHRLTGMRQPHEQAGEELLNLLTARIENGGASLPGRFLPVGFHPGSTTGEAENQLLREAGNSLST